MKLKNIVWGLIFISIGVILIINRYYTFNLISMDKLWPLFVFTPGLLFEIDYFSTRKNAGELVPGGILMSLGILFFFETYTKWHYSGYTWPFYLLSVDIGLLQLYFFGGKRKALLIPVFILAIISGLSFLSMLYNSWFDKGLLPPILFILLGLYVLLKSSKKHNQ